MRARGFTLIEVLVALAILAIGLTALLKALSQSVHTATRIKYKTLSHWVAEQGVAMVQLNLLQITSSEATTQETTLLNTHVYWRIRFEDNPFPKVQRFTILTSANETGPFEESLSAFRVIS